MDLIELARAVSPLEAAAVGFGVLYLGLAIRQNILCWPAGLVGSLLSVALLFDVRLYGESALQLFYAAMSVYGWRQWRAGKTAGGGAELPVRTWPAAAHVAAIGGSVAV